MKLICGRMLTASVVGVVLLAGVVGCKSNSAVKQGNGGKAAAVPLDPATLGTVTGTVQLSGKPPEPVEIDMSMDPVCSMTGADNFAEQYVVKNGKLQNVYVYIKSGPPAAMSATSPASSPIVMNQVGCKYVPHVIALKRGGSVEFRNSDDTMHNVHTMPTVAGDQPIDVTQGPKGAPQTKQFNEAEVMLPVRCNNHPWMNAFINVSATPFFAVTDAAGHFSISGLPAGTYTLAAVHEKMGEQTMTVTVEPKQTAKADFSFTAK